MRELETPEEHYGKMNKIGTLMREALRGGTPEAQAFGDGLLVLPGELAPTKDERRRYRTIVSVAGDVWQSPPGRAVQGGLRITEVERAAYLAGFLSTLSPFRDTHPTTLLPLAKQIIALVEEKL